MRWCDQAQNEGADTASIAAEVGQAMLASGGSADLAAKSAAKVAGASLLYIYIYNKEAPATFAADFAARSAEPPEASIAWPTSAAIEAVSAPSFCA